MELAQRYSNLDTVQKTLRMLQSAGLISPDGRPVDRSDRSREPIVQPFKLTQRLDNSTINEIITNYESGKSSYELAEECGISKNSVIKLLREAGVPIRNQPLTDQQVTEAIRLYEAGKSLAKIGAHLGVDHGTVWRQLKKCGVEMRDTHGKER